MYHFPPYPIHTAPRDGTRIFIIGPDDGNLYESWWNPEGNSLTENGLDDTGAWFCETGGWFEPHEVHLWVPRDTPTSHYGAEKQKK